MALPILKTRPEPSPIAPDYRYGWREEAVIDPAGTMTYIQIPLTAEQALHPEEHYIMPQPRLQDIISSAIAEMLKPYCSGRDPLLMVTRDLIIKWDKPSLRQHAPDIAIIPNVPNQDQPWGIFEVAKEGTRPCLIIEIVSEATRQQDRKTKVIHYAKAGVQEYVFIDHRFQRGKMTWELVGFYLGPLGYVAIRPDEDGAIFLETIEVRLGLDNGQVWIEDGQTGRPLLGLSQLHRAFTEAEERANLAEERANLAEEKAEQERLARQKVEKLLAELLAQRPADDSPHT